MSNLRGHSRADEEKLNSGMMSRRNPTPMRDYQDSHFKKEAVSNFEDTVKP